MATILPYLFAAFVAVLAVTFCFGLFHAFRLFTRLGGKDAMSESSAAALAKIKGSAVTIAVLMVAGIAGLMVLARGKGEDIAGIVAPGILVVLLSVAVATAATVFQKRVQKAMGGRSV